jgi:predicted ATPase
LVIAEVSDDGTMRYRLLEPIRQYAHDLLEAADDAQTVHLRHADYFIELGEQAEPDLYGGRRFAYWLDRLQPERGQLPVGTPLVYRER